MGGIVTSVKQRLERLLDEAIDLDEPERSGFIDAACAGDPELRAALDSETLALPNLEELEFTGTIRQTFTGNERFEILRRLGAGGFGEVFEVFDRTLGSTVALKVLRRVDAGTVESFKRGFRALERLTHPNVCHAYELVFDTGSESWLLTMERIYGEPLLDYLAAHPEHSRAVLLQVARGLHALHQAEVLHCDIKPSNVLITSEVRAVLVDFGLARPVDSPRDRAFAMTPDYAAPELIAGAPHSPASDWYATGRMIQRAVGNRDDELGRLAARLLAYDPEVRPSGAEVLQVLTGVGDPGDPQRGVFVGREREISSVRESFRAAASGTSVTLHIAGPSGIGKTAMVLQAISAIRAEHPGTIVLRGACYQGEALPYKALDAVAEEISRELDKLPFREALAVLPGDIPLLARLFPAFGPFAVNQLVETADQSDPLETRRRAFAAFWKVAEGLSRVAPLLIMIDDLQWSDLDSSLLLAEFTGKIRMARILLITLRRQEAAPPPGFESLRTGARELDLGPLTSAESIRLVQQLMDSQSADTLATVVAEGAGSPFLLRQLAIHVRSGGAAIGLTELMKAVIADLTMEQREVLEVLAVAESPLNQFVLQQAARTGAGFALSRSQLINRCLIRGVNSPGGECAPYHDRIGEAVAVSLPRDRQREIHEALARALDQSGDLDLERVATHYHKAGFLDLACQRGRQAAERAASVLAFDRATHIYQCVLDWSQDKKGEHGLLERALGDALVNCGRGIEGARAYERALAQTPGPSQMTLRTRIASVLLRSGEIEEGLCMLRTILREHGLPEPSSAARMFARMLWERFRVEVRRRRPIRTMRDESAEARLDACWAAAVGTSMVLPLFKEICCLVYLRLALDEGSANRLAIGWSVFASNLAHVDDGELRASRAAMERGGQYAAESGDVYARAFVEFTWSVIELLAGKWKKSGDHAVRAREQLISSCPGSSWEAGAATTGAISARAITGDWLSNARETPELVKRARDQGDRFTEVSAQLIWGHYAPHLIADEPVEAEEVIQRCLTIWPNKDFDFQRLHAFEGLVEIDLYRGRGHSAWSRVERTWPEIVRSGLLRITLLETFTHAARARAALARANCESGIKVRSSLLEAAANSAKRLHRSKARYAAGLGFMIDAGIAACLGERDRTRKMLLRAEAELEANDMIPWLAAVRISVAPLLDGEAGRRKAEAGHSWMASQGIRRPDYITRMFLPMPPL